MLAGSYPYVLLPVVLRRTEDPSTLPPAMRPIPLPELTDGPHKSYALQWFSFAGIALIGGVALFVRRSSAGGDQDSDERRFSSDTVGV